MRAQRDDEKPRRVGKSTDRFNPFRGAAAHDRGAVQQQVAPKVDEVHPGGIGAAARPRQLVAGEAEIQSVVAA